MMLGLQHIETALRFEGGYDQSFFDDVIDLFLGLNGGHVGKYCYDGANWDAVVENSDAYYIPRADNELVQQAVQEIADYVPPRTPYVDFGVGGINALKQHVLPIISKLGSASYIGIDFCENALASVEAAGADLLKGVTVETVRTDFFLPSRLVVSRRPGLGVMNGLTVTNKYGTLRDKAVGPDLVAVLRQLSRFAGHGWLLLTIDTNQNEASLRRAYETPMTSGLYLNVFRRMARELPTHGFDPSLFAYDPEWHPDVQLFAHMARATEDQDFMIGPFRAGVKRGEKLHLLNSYKFEQGFFEAQCRMAGLSVLRHWDHPTGMKLYLLSERSLADRNVTATKR